MTSFFNNLTNAVETECTETRDGRWFIRMGFAGFNSPANNRSGYASKEAAERACRKYGSR